VVDGHVVDVVDQLGRDAREVQGGHLMGCQREHPEVTVVVDPQQLDVVLAGVGRVFGDQNDLAEGVLDQARNDSGSIQSVPSVIRARGTHLTRR
jgi:hypothetical protein